jgi:serine/threonine-protein kinase Chk1
MPVVHESLRALNVKCKPVPNSTVSGDRQQLRLRIGGLDRRKVAFKGWVIVESFNYGGRQGSFCVMQRDEVSVTNPSQDNFDPSLFNRAHLCPGDSYGKRS